jgi:hypothetical protein
VDVAAVLHRRAQQRPAITVGRAHEPALLAVHRQCQQVEQHQVDRGPPGEARSVGRRGLHARLEHAEVGPPGLVQRHDLAVQDRPVRHKSVREFRDLGVRAVTSLPFLLITTTPPPPTPTIARTPSHFISYAQPAR